jgi:hypothetical protein
VPRGPPSAEKGPLVVARRASPLRHRDAATPFCQYPPLARRRSEPTRSQAEARFHSAGYRAGVHTGPWPCQPARVTTTPRPHLKVPAAHGQNARGPGPASRMEDGGRLARGLGDGYRCSHGAARRDHAAIRILLAFLVHPATCEMPVCSEPGTPLQLRPDWLLCTI